MAGQGTIIIGSRQWSVTIATTMAEVAAGLSNVQSIPAGTGMLFDLGADYTYIPINMDDMLFPLDIVFINSSRGVVGGLGDVDPGQEGAVYSGALGARFFLEVNAGEADGVEVGEEVTISGLPVTASVWEAIIQFVIATMVVVSGVAVLGKGILWKKDGEGKE